MSRIGRQPIQIPAGVEVALDGNTVRVKGPKGSLERSVHAGTQVSIEAQQILVQRPNDSATARAMHGLTRTLIANMVEGVTRGFEKRLELSGVGYRAAKSGSKLVLTVGYSHPVEIEPPQGIDIEVPTPTSVVVRGANKEHVGETAAKVRSTRPPEPYQGKGIRYAGERVRRKVGKTGKK